MNVCATCYHVAVGILYFSDLMREKSIWIFAIFLSILHINITTCSSHASCAQRRANILLIVNY